MRFEIVLAPEAVGDLQRLDAYDRVMVRDALERHLRHEPRKVSKSRIKQLGGMSRPQFRLRVGEIRVFYDLSGPRVEVLAIVSKRNAAQWLEQIGERDEKDSSL